MTMGDEIVRGVIDRFEGDYAVLVLDDGQQLDWPRSTLADDAQPGMAVVLSLSFLAESLEPEDEDNLSAQAADTWQGELATEQSRWLVRFPDGQKLNWPTTMAAMAQRGSRVNLLLLVDAEDTEARRKRVTGLLDDIFGTR
jgi:hypothetical protein